MKIVIIGPAHPYRGGIAKFNEVLAESFTREGHEVHIITFTMQYPSFLFPGKSQYTDAAAPSNFTIERSINSVNPFSWLRTVRKIRKTNPDLVIVRYWMPFFAPSLGYISRQTKCKVVALTDNVVPHESHFYDRPLTRYFLNSIDGVVYMSHQVGGELDEYRFKGLKAFSPHPIYDTYGEAVPREVAIKELGLDPAYRYSLFFGFIRDYKGLDLLLEAWSHVSDQSLRLIVAGEYYGNRDKYEAMINALDLSERVSIHDFYIPEERVKFYFSASDLVIQPYRSATQSGVTQIAYHFNTPMIVTDVGGLSEIVPHGKVGYVVDQDPRSITQSIEEYYASHHEAEFRENILIEKKRFEWSQMTETFINLYRKMQ